jgi:NhaP-type Na+/H+ or K+/H+ antiporter
MSGSFLLVVALLIMFYACFADRLERWNLSAPMVFMTVGVVFFGFLNDVSIGDETIRLVAEVTLVVVLFHDASSVRVSALRSDPWVPVRLLAVGFPLALLATFGTVLWLAPAMGVAGAVLLAGALTPTDAGLGAPTVMNPAVPTRIRRALNVESGLNDGLATPIVLIALSALVAQEGDATASVLQVTVVPVVLAIVLAGVVGVGAAAIIDLSQSRDFSSSKGRAIVVLALPLVLWGAAELIGANGFIAAFVGGLVFGARSGCLHEEGEAAELLETSADLLSFVIWFLAGGLIIATFESGFEWIWLILAVLALTVLRIIPVMISLIGSGLTLPSQLFIGWFGPRGLATIVFALLAVEELGPDSPMLTTIVGVTSTTVVLSVIAHGATAQPLAKRFSQWCQTNEENLTTSSSATIRTRGRGTKHRT